MLDSYSDHSQDKSSALTIQRLSLLGTSRMHRNLQRSGRSLHYAEKMGAVIAYVGWLVNLAANLTELAPPIADNDRRRLRELSEIIENIRQDFLHKRIPSQIKLHNEKNSSGSIPFLEEMEITVALIGEAFESSQSLVAFAPVPAPPQQWKRLFVADAFTNPDHFHFGIKGGLAAFLCYLTYNLIAWPGISTAVTTCLLTALTTIGSSHQKQILRFGGALAGGAIAMIAQVFILPSLDSIAGFVVLFVTVTIFDAWFATCGPRLSYFGAQVMVAFYLVNLGEFRFQTSLAVARDRVAGIMLGLLVMWLVFDQLWGSAAVVEMKRIFNTNLRMMAQLTQEPVSKDLRVAVEKGYSLRETINMNFDRVRQQGDAVMFEFGSSREHALATRTRLLRWQLQLQRIFIARIAMLKYRLSLPAFDLPPTIHSVQQKFDVSQAAMLEGMADRLDGEATHAVGPFNFSFDDLRKIVQSCPHDSPDHLAAHLETFLPLSARLDTLVRSLDQEI